MMARIPKGVPAKSGRNVLAKWNQTWLGKNARAWRNAATSMTL
jgi:hypothetical protein